MSITVKDLEILYKEEFNNEYYKKIEDLQTVDLIRGKKEKSLKIESILNQMKLFHFWEDLKQGSGHRSFKHKLTGKKFMVSGHSKEEYLFGSFAKGFCDMIKDHKAIIDRIFGGFIRDQKHVDFEKVKIQYVLLKKKGQKHE